MQIDESAVLRQSGKTDRMHILRKIVLYLTLRRQACLPKKASGVDINQLARPSLRGTDPGSTVCLNDAKSKNATQSQRRPRQSRRKGHVFQTKSTSATCEVTVHKRSQDVT